MMVPTKAICEDWCGWHHEGPACEAAMAEHQAANPTHLMVLIRTPHGVETEGPHQVLRHCADLFAVPWGGFGE